MAGGKLGGQHVLSPEKQVNSSSARIAEFDSIVEGSPR